MCVDGWVFSVGVKIVVGEFCGGGERFVGCIYQLCAVWVKVGG